MTQQISNHIGFLFVQICRAHRQWVDTELNKLGVHVGQEMILLRLAAEDGIPQSSLVDHLCVEPPTITKMLQRMERSDLVERRSDPADARVSLVYLTVHGRSLITPILDIWERLESQILVDVTESERLLLRRLLLQVQTNLA